MSWINGGLSIVKGKRCMIAALHSDMQAQHFFEVRLLDSELLTILFDIVLDESEDYSNDARMEAAY